MRYFRALVACAAVVAGVFTRTYATPAALPTLSPAAARGAAIVYVWHDVLPRKAVWFDTTTADLASEFDRLARGGYHVVPLSLLRDHVERGAPLPARAVFLTFDDNGAGIYRNAYPLLRAHRFPATLFVHTNYVGVTTSKAHCTWDQLREMERSGLVDVQSLTANHPPDLTVLSDSSVMHEFALSARSLRVRLGRAPYAIVYPYDVYDMRVASLARRAGYTLGFTEDHGLVGDSPSPLEIHRYSLANPALFETGLADLDAAR